jgi:hypothetical protein
MKDISKLRTYYSVEWQTVEGGNHSTVKCLNVCWDCVEHVMDNVGVAVSSVHYTENEVECEECNALIVRGSQMEDFIP